jgi:hypothetical protein
MLALRKNQVALFVDRSSQQWVVQDVDGNFWLVPSGENAWERRKPCQLTDAMELESIPGHYKYMLGLPF